MNSILEIPLINESDLTINNLISLYSSPVDIAVDGGNYKLCLSLDADKNNSQNRYVAILKIAASTVIVTINQWPEFIVKNNSDIIPLLSSRSSLVRKLTNKVLLSPIIRWVENTIGEEPIVCDITEEEIQFLKPYAFYFKLTSESGEITSGAVKINSANSAELEKLLCSRALDLNNNLEQLEIKLRLQIGSSILSSSQLYDLEMGDVILFDQDIYGADKNIMATISNRICLLLKFKKIDREPYEKEDVLMVDKIPNKLYTDNEISDENSAIELTNKSNLELCTENSLGQNKNVIDEISVKLEFELGSLSLPISEVKKLSPGYILPLDKPLEKSVQIFSNGQLLGIGEVVNVEGKTGVRLKSFLGK